MTANQTDDRSGAATAEDRKAAHGNEALGKRRWWQTNIPSIVSLVCGSLALGLFVVAARSDKRQLLYGQVDMSDAISVGTVLGISATLLGVVGIVVSCDFWFRVVAIFGGFAGVLPGGCGLITTLISWAMPK